MTSSVSIMQISSFIFMELMIFLAFANVNARCFRFVFFFLRSEALPENKIRSKEYNFFQKRSFTLIPQIPRSSARDMYNQRFQPAQYKGKRVRIWANQTIRFEFG